MTLRINIACGSDVRDDFVNLDVVRQWPTPPRPCDAIWDARKDRLPFDDNSVDEAVAGYLFLHTAPCHHDRLIRDIHRVLKPRGRLEVGEVDMEVTMRRWLANPNDASANQMIWGEMGCDDKFRPIPGMIELAEFDKHCQGFTETTLRALLKRGGFETEAIRFKRHQVYYELSLEVWK